MTKYAMLPRAGTDMHGLAMAITDDSWLAQQKIDGRRILLDISPSHVVVRNRSGDTSSKTVEILDYLGDWAYSLRDEGFDVILDGEWVDGTYFVFDLKRFSAHTETDPYIVRWANLRALMHTVDDETPIKLVPSAFTEEDKLNLVSKCIESKSEGIIVRKINAPYTSGRSDAIKKVKFKYTVDAIVMEHVEGKDSVEVGLIDGDNVVSIGHCSTRLKEKPELASVIEIEYLYLSEGKRLVQPIMKRIRDDKDVYDCTMDQLVSSNTKQLVSW